jgi:hypothetical protein
MTTIKLIILITFLSCSNIGKKDIIVVGQAFDAKAGLASWNDSIYGKVVRVKGKLLIEKFEPQKEGEPEKQQIVGIKMTILKPKWELVK